MCELLELLSGWCNRPGRPELVSYTTYSHGFKLNIRLHSPDHLGGIEENKFVYDIYLSDAVDDELQYIKTVNSSSDLITISLTSEVRIYGIDSLRNVFYLTAQQIIMDKNLLGIAISLTESPVLVIDVLCDLVG